MPSYVTERSATESSAPDSAAQLPLFARRLMPGGNGPHRDLAAGIAVIAVLTQLAFAQLTLLLVICCVLIDRLSRWRSSWLLLPTVIGFAWLLAIGPGSSLSGYLAGGNHVIGLLAERGTLLARIGHLRGALNGWQHWLPRQLPVALIVAAAEAAVLGLPGRAARSARYRPGLLVWVRRGYLTLVLRRGELATAEGCCLGIVESSGVRAELTWREAEAGLLCLSHDPAAVSAIGRDLVLAAIQHRKSVIVIDLNGRDPASQPGRVGQASRVGRVGQASLADQAELACAEVNAPLRCFGWQSACFDPIAEASPAKAASLVLAMIDWTGAGEARRLLCTSYLETALRVLAAARAASSPTASAQTASARASSTRTRPSRDASAREASAWDAPAREGRAWDASARMMSSRDASAWNGSAHAASIRAASAREVSGLAASAGRPAPVLDELVSLLAPGALPARLAQLRGHPGGRGELATKVTELTGQLGGDYSVLAPVVGQLTDLARELTPKASARSARDPADPQPITILAALANREVAYFPLDRPVRGRPAEMIARLVIASLTDALTGHHDLGIGSDCLVWIDGCEFLDARQVGALISLGARTGTAVALGTTVAATAAALAPAVNVIALRGSAPPGLGSQGLGSQGIGSQALGSRGPGNQTPGQHLPDDRLPPGDRPDRLSWTVLGPPPRLVTGCKVVR